MFAQKILLEILNQRDTYSTGQKKRNFWKLYLTEFIYEKQQYSLEYYYTYTHIQSVLLPDRQTLRGDSRHENKHY